LPPSHPARIYKQVWDRLSIDSSGILVLDSDRIVIPASQRKEILQLLHAAHPGMVKMKTLARQHYYWPLMTRDIENAVQQCEPCVQNLAQQPVQKPLIDGGMPDDPMDEVAADLYSYGGKDYLAMVDRHSGWIWTARLMKTSTSDVIHIMEKWFLLFGYPLRIRTDGGPQFRGPFREFCMKHDVQHETSSPYNPQSNGLAESAVKASKMLLDKNSGHFENFEKALSAYNDLPRSDGIAPSDLMFHRRKRGPAPLPTMHKRISGDALIRKETKSDYVSNHNANATGKQYKLFAPGTPVVVQHPNTKRWTIKGRVVAMKHNNRTYEIEDESGGTFVRARKFVKLRTEGEEIPPVRRGQCDAANDSPVESTSVQPIADNNSAANERVLRGRRVRFRTET